MATDAAFVAPAGPRLQDYPADVAAGDLYHNASPELAALWLTMAEGLANMAGDAGIPVQELVSRQIADLGMSFRMAGDADERDWPLTAMPLLIGPRSNAA